MPYDNTSLPACWQDVADVLTAGIDRVLLYGPPGTGKTYAGLTFGDVQAGAFRLVCTEDMTAADVTGCWMPSDRKSTRLNSSHVSESRMPSSA